MYETRVARVFTVFAGCLAALALRAFTLQVADRDRVLEEHERRVRGRFVLAPRRGEITYADGAPIAWNEPGFSIEIDLETFFARRWRCDVCGAVTRRTEAPAACAECSSKQGFTRVAAPDAAALARLAGVSEGELGSALSRVFELREGHPDFRSFELLDEVPRETALAVALAANRFPGIVVRARASRAADTVAKSVVGRTSEPYLEDVDERRDPARAERGERIYSPAEVYSMRFGRTGLEAAFDDRLRGDPGLAARGSRRAREPRIVIPVADGAAVHTTLLRGVQTLAEEIVGSATGDAAAVVMDVADGSVVAIASKTKSGYHRAVTSIRPGSVFKLATALAVLESGIPETDTVVCEHRGRLPSGAPYVCDENHGPLSLRDAFAHSCNAYFATMAERVGTDGMLRACRGLGLDVNPPLHLKGSAAGLDPIYGRGSRWRPADLGLLGIGQGKALVSPLQIAMAYARLASGGRRLVPYLVAEDAPPPPQVDEAIARFAPVLRDAARRVVVSGTGSGLPQLNELDAAGKSGTGDVDKDGALNNAWFVAFAPASSPRFVAVVVYEHVKDHGAAKAGPPVARLLEEALR